MPIPIDNSNPASTSASTLTIIRMNSIAPIPSGQLNGTSRTNSQRYELSDAAQNCQPPERKKIGPYFLGRELGRGSMGVVHVAVHERWRTKVAMKVFEIPPKEDSFQRWDKLTEIFKELRLLKSLHHPNILECYEHFELEREAGISTELATGGDVFQYLQAHGRFKNAKASQLFAQLISGVSYLHAKGITHRDLKIENLLLDRAGPDGVSNLIIADFELACRDDSMTLQCGTPGFYAPEVVLQKSYRKEADIWSCGIILYEMLTGKYPYKFKENYNLNWRDEINQFYQQVLMTIGIDFPTEMHIDRGAQNLICEMLNSWPETRINLERIKNDPWLAAHKKLLQCSVEDLEKIAREQQLKKANQARLAALYPEDNNDSWAKWFNDYLSRLYADGHWFCKQICSIASKIWRWRWH